MKGTKLYVRTARTVRKGEEVTIAYERSICYKGPAERKSTLQAQFFGHLVSCCCERCNDPARVKAETAMQQISPDAKKDRELKTALSKMSKLPVNTKDVIEMDRALIPWVKETHYLKFHIYNLLHFEMWKRQHFSQIAHFPKVFIEYLQQCVVTGMLGETRLMCTWAAVMWYRYTIPS